jgi:hypothetical protein
MRKFGPLPAWAWAAIGAVALVIVRRSPSLGAGLGGGSAGARPVTDATSPDTSDGTAGPPSRDPVTLQPGESVYDPNSGELHGTAPQQQPGLDDGATGSARNR